MADKKQYPEASPPAPLEPAADEFQEPSLTTYDSAAPRVSNPDITPIELIPPPSTHEKSDLGRALADVELRDLTITRLNRDIITLQHDVARLRDKLVEDVLMLATQVAEIDSLKEKLATALDDRAALAARLKAALITTLKP